MTNAVLCGSKSRSGQFRKIRSVESAVFLDARQLGLSHLSGDLTFEIVFS